MCINILHGTLATPLNKTDVKLKSQIKMIKDGFIFKLSVRLLVQIQELLSLVDRLNCIAGLLTTKILLHLKIQSKDCFKSHFLMTALMVGAKTSFPFGSL